MKGGLQSTFLHGSVVKPHCMGYYQRRMGTTLPQLFSYLLGLSWAYSPRLSVYLCHNAVSDLGNGEKPSDKRFENSRQRVDSARPANAFI